MGGGTILHTNHSMPQLRDTLNNLSSSSDSTLSCSFCHTLFCTRQPVPSQHEIEDAISALQQFMQAISSSSTLQQISGSYGQRTVMSQGYKRLHDALQLLHADPAMKRLVVSLSSDKAVWDAVISNVMRQKVLELPDPVERGRPQISELHEFGMHMNWTLDIIKGKILELIESFQSLVNDLFQSPKMKNAAVDVTRMDEKVRSSFLLSMVILLIVIVARSQGLYN